MNVTWIYSCRLGPNNNCSLVFFRQSKGHKHFCLADQDFFCRLPYILETLQRSSSGEFLWRNRTPKDVSIGEEHDGLPLQKEPNYC